jgi:Domain of unknown function (DUF4440)
MKKFVMVALLGLLAIAPGCTLYGERPVINHWADATGGQGLENSFWEAVKSKSWDDLSGHVADNYLNLTSQGKMDRTAALARLQHFHLESYSLQDVQTELHGNTFVVTYQLILRGTFDDKPLSSDPVRMMTVWQHQAKGWVAIARSEM